MILAAFVFAPTALLAQPAPQTQQATQILRASPLGPPGHLLNRQVLRGWADAVRAATAGRVEIQVLPDAVAPPPKVLAAVRDGRADVAILSTGASETPLPLNGLVEFAGQTPNAERASIAYQRIVTRYPALGDEFEGVELLSVFTHGPGALLLAMRGRTATGQLQGTTLHAGSSGAANAVVALGAKPVMAPGPAAKGLLAEGKVDGTVTVVETLDGFGLAPNIAEVDVMPGGLYSAGFALVVNQKRWESISADDREAIRKVSGEVLAAQAGRAWDAADAQALRGARERGVPVVQTPEALQQRVRAASAAREQIWADGMGVFALDAKNALAEYREELANATK